MNNVVLMGRLTKDPIVRQAGESSVASFSIAVNRRFKREGQPEADFFNCSAFGKTGEFISKYFKKGQRILVSGEIQNNNYTNKEGQQVYATQIMVAQAEFCESKGSGDQGGNTQPAPAPSGDIGDGFMNIPEGIEQELPFN